jgi:hypothetical protein
MYAHMQRPLAPEICPHEIGGFPVTPNFVDTDTVLGLVGNSGNSTGPHLHVDRTVRDATFKDWADGLPLYWTDVVSIAESQGPDDFPFAPDADAHAQHGSSVLLIGIHPPQPPPETTCTPVTGSLGDEDGHPDGDYAIDYFCPDAEGESVCVEGIENSQSYGYCASCTEDPFKPAGCACQHDDECANGLTCWGTEVGNGGATGQCYSATEGPPSWQCTFVCDELYGDGAWCYNNHPGGHATCYDYLTSEPTAWNCHAYGAEDGDCDGDCPGGPLYAYEDECIVECTFDSDCGAIGYPDHYLCGNAWGNPQCLDPIHAP